MSAFYALAYSDRIELLTDGAIYSDDGTLVDIRMKVHLSEDVPLVITGRGSSAVVDLFAAGMIALSGCGNVDHALQEIDAMLQRRADQGAPEEAEWLLASISETRGPMLLYAATADLYGYGLEPWRLHDVGKEWGGGPAVDCGDIDASCGLRDCGAELFERMRQVSAPNPAKPDLPPIHGIGGHVDLTTVLADGCTVERLHTWPDTVGEKIDPRMVA
ncbi:hypothetical protein [Shinella zoogloeoides]|uniref:hypothetical protein n=1 Tax=Shinella zoogloeoides TaxID=352475 RepID=UPI001F57F8B6|nr:hypothetical protein [Shinella zoogloeoides]